MFVGENFGCNIIIKLLEVGICVEVVLRYCIFMIPKENAK